MPSKRRATRTAQLQPQAAAAANSDYDTDTVNPSDIATPLAPPKQRTNTELNLTVLRRYSPDIEHILSIAPFAVVYTFSPESQQWEKCGIEGTLFVCQLSGSARYNVMILNRKSLDNFITELVSADDIEITEQYVILQATGEDGVTPAIYGIWIFSDGETEPSTREIVAQTIQSCAMQAQIAREEVDAESDGADGHAQGQEEEQEYGMDGTTQHQEQMDEEEAVAQQAGQTLDLLQLFGSKPVQPQALPQATHVPHSANAPSPAAASPLFAQQPMRFTPTADTDFFRSTSSPAAAQQQQAPSAQTQQNALLNLFKR